MRPLVFVLTTLFSSHLVGQPPMKTAIVNVSIVDVEKGAVIKARTVLIDGGSITAIRRFSKREDLPGYQIINATGKYLIPGLIDSHTHLHYFFQIGQQHLLQAPLNIFLYWG